MPIHLGSIDTAAKSAILTGNPERVTLLAEELGAEVQRWEKRGYVCAEVSVGEEPLLVCSTGIGGPSLAIALEELGQLGVTSFVRLGTCGILQRHVRPGDLVLSTASVRDDGTSGSYLPASYPAAADFSLLRAMVAEARASGARHWVGVTHSKDAYYAEEPEGWVLADRWAPRWRALRDTGVLATEMEAAALFTIAMLRSWRAAALCVALDDETGPEVLRASLLTGARMAVAALTERPTEG